MNIKESKYLLFFLAFLCIFLSFIILYYFNNLKQCNYRLEKSFEVHTQHMDELTDIEKDAVSRWAKRNKMKPSQVLGGRRSILSSKNNEQCVVLALEMGSTGGGNPIYCYNSDGELIEKYEDVE